MTQIIFSESFILDREVLPKQDALRYELVRVVKELRNYTSHSEIYNLISTSNFIKATNNEKMFIANFDNTNFNLDSNYCVAFTTEHLPESLSLLMVGEENSVFDRMDIDRNPETADENLHSEHEVVITEELLENAGIPEDLWNDLIGGYSFTEWHFEILPHRVPSGRASDAQLKKLNHLIQPPKIYAVATEPNFTITGLNELGFGDLDKWLLKLDPSQQAIADLFGSSDLTEGPWEVEGGPGTGKTAIALQAIRNVIVNLDPGKKVDILFTAYNRMLAALAEKLLRQMLDDEEFDMVTIKTIHSSCIPYCDSEVNKYISDQWNNFNWQNTKIDAAIEEIIDKRNFGTLKGEVELIHEEIEWNIIDVVASTEDEYTTHARDKFSKKEKEQVWQIYLDLRENGVWFPQDRLRQAIPNIKSGIEKYDYVFVDEVQDVQQSGVEVAKAFCKNGKNVFICGDENQCIFSPRKRMFGFFDKAIKAIQHVGGLLRKAIGIEAEDSGFKWMLSVNHRTSIQVVAGITDLVNAIGITQVSENWMGKPKFNGKKPVFRICKAQVEEYKYINEFVLENCVEDNLDLKSVCLMTNRHGDPDQAVIRQQLSNLNPQLNPRSFRSSSFHEAFTHNGIRIVFIQSIKGLDVPITIISGLTKKNWPDLFNDLIDEDRESIYNRENQERLLVTALSRSTKHLLITTLEDDCPDFVQKLDDTLWDINR